MEPNEIPGFVKLISDVHAYYRQPVSEFVLQVWQQGCKPFTLEQVSKAMNAHVADAERGVYLPKIADVVRSLAGTHTDRAQLAWGKALEAVTAVGAYTDVIFDDPAIHAVIEDMGGWPKFCRTESKDMGYLQHRFCESHMAYTGRGKFEYQRKLSGDRSPDFVYEKSGLQHPKAALIGDAEIAKKVFSIGNIAGKTAIIYERTKSISDLSALAIDNTVVKK